jgi:hypothetical protein
MALYTAQYYSCICTILLLISIYIRYKIWLQWAKTVEKYTKYDGFVNTGLWKEIVIELLVNVVAPMPMFNGMKYTEYNVAFDATIQYEVNDILLFFAFMRLYLTLKFLLYLS